MNLSRRHMEDLSSRLANQVVDGRPLSNESIDMTLQVVLSRSIVDEVLEEEQDCRDSLDEMERLVPRLAMTSGDARLDVIAEINNKLVPIVAFIGDVEPFEVEPVMYSTRECINRILRLTRELKKLGDPQWLATGVHIVLKLLDVIIKEDTKPKD